MDQNDFVADPKVFMEAGYVVIPWVPSGSNVPTQMEIYLKHVANCSLNTGQKKVWAVCQKKENTDPNLGPFLKIYWAPYENRTFGGTGNVLMLDGA